MWGTHSSTPLDLPPFYVRDDLDEQHHDDTGPERPTERVQQVGHQSKRLRRWRRSEQVATDLGNVYQVLRREGTQRAIIDTMQTRSELYDYLGYHAYEQKLDALFAREK